MIPMLRALAGSGSTTVEIVTLSGTFGSPNLSTDTEADPSSAVSGWKFKTDGGVEKLNGVTNTYVAHEAGTEWCSDGRGTNVSPVHTYYIRAQLNGAGDVPTSGPTLNTWVALTTERVWEQLVSSEAIRECILQIQIDTVGNGSNIIATGQYKFYSEVTPEG